MRFRRLVWAMAGGTLAIAACGKGPEPVAAQAPPSASEAGNAPADLDQEAGAAGAPSTAAEAPPPVAPSPEPPTPPAPPVLPAATTFAETNNALARSLYAVLSRKPGNLFFSPTSLSTALAMVYAGARGETATEMARALSLFTTGEALHAEIARASATLRARTIGTGNELSIANRLWPDRTVQLEPAFVALTKKHYGAAPEPLDFVGAPEPSRSRINAWIAQRTKQAIPELFVKGSLGPDTALVLTNAVYFKGSWAEHFDPKQTRPGPFHPTEGPVTTTPFMNDLRFDVQVGATKDAQVLELPYRSARKGTGLVMDVILPHRSTDLATLERNVVSAGFEPYLQALHHWDKVQISLPRFKISWAQDLAEPLQELGMRAAFTNAADFSGLGRAGSGAPLRLDLVRHEATVDVREEGTVAAAATGLRVMAVSGPMHFDADRPFLFLLRDRETGVVLFVGRLAKPS